MSTPRTIEEASAGLRSGAFTSSDLIESSLAAIASDGGRTNAFILVDATGAREAASACDIERRHGVDRGPLHGIPISVKDLIDVAGQPTTAASRVLAHAVATRDAPVVMRLREAGAVIIGKTNLHEFALGTTSEESAWGPVRNPIDASRSAGGSSGGSAAAVAALMGLASLGSDTGGSIRIPSAACGVVGLKPCVGEVPTDGVVPLSFTLDHVGPIARSVQDAASIWAVLTSRKPATIARAPLDQLTLGALQGYFTALLSDDVRAAFEHALAVLSSAGVSVTPVEVTGAERTAETYVNLALPEAALWHARYLDRQGGDYGAPVRARLESGRAISAVSYLSARQTRLTLTAAVDRALADGQALVLPTLPIVAPPLGASDVSLDAMGQMMPVRSAMLRLTQLFNITGHPAISLPLPTMGLPVGLQLVGRRHATADLLSVAAACEAALAAH